MALAAVVESLESLPEALHSYYKEIDGKYVLDADIEAHPQVQGLRGAYKADHAQVQTLKEKFQGVDLERWNKLKSLKDEDFELLETLRNDTRKSTPNGTASSTQLDLEAEIEKRLRPMKTAHQAELEKRAEMQRAVEAERESIREEMRRTRIQTALMAACTEAGVLPNAVEDVVSLSHRYFKINDNGEVTAVDPTGVDLFGSDGKPMRPREWISTRGAEKAHWFPLNAGGGANGGRFNGESRPSKKSDLKDLKARVEFVKKYGQEAYLALADG